MKSYSEIQEEIRKYKLEEVALNWQEKSDLAQERLAKQRIYQNDGEESNCSGSTTSSTPGT